MKMNAGVIGGGTWGSAFALHLGRLNIQTKLWIREPDIFSQTVKTRENAVFLPGFFFPETVTFYDKLEEAVEADVIFIAVPSQFCRNIYKRIAPFLSSRRILISLTKGIEGDSLKRMTEVMEEIFSHSGSPQTGVLSGPSFAREVAEQHPTAVVLASGGIDIARKTQHLISSPHFRVYTTNDVIGIELAGALKNVIAIAAGTSEALDFGSNTIAALITRGIAEITRLGLKMGARRETFGGLGGIGDLVLTCTGALSRNRYLGLELGRGKTLNEVISGMKQVAEGVTTTLSAYRLSRREKVELPICEQIYRVLYKNKNPKAALRDLMTRKLKDEFFVQERE